MRKADMAEAWAVFTTPAAGRVTARASVCEQREWDVMDRDDPGRHALVRANIRSEQEAERLARDASGYVPPSRGAGRTRPKAGKRPPASRTALGPKSLPAAA